VRAQGLDDHPHSHLHLHPRYACAVHPSILVSACAYVISFTYAITVFSCAFSYACSYAPASPPVFTYGYGYASRSERACMRAQPPLSWRRMKRNENLLHVGGCVRAEDDGGDCACHHRLYIRIPARLPQRASGRTPPHPIVEERELAACKGGCVWVWVWDEDERSRELRDATDSATGGRTVCGAGAGTHRDVERERERELAACCGCMSLRECVGVGFGERGSSDVLSEVFAGESHRVNDHDPFHCILSQAVCRQGAERWAEDGLLLLLLYVLVLFLSFFFTHCIVVSILVNCCNVYIIIPISPAILQH
jgi:hypothetical protein